MAEPTANLTPEQQQAVQEAQRQFEEMKGNVAQAMGRARTTTERFLEMARERQAHARSQQAEARELLDKMLTLQGQPSLHEHISRMTLLDTMYGRQVALLDAEVGVLEGNLRQIADVPEFTPRADFPEQVPFKVQAPQENLEVRLRRALLDVAMLDYHWFRNRQGIDVVCRATGIDLRPFEGDEAAQAGAAEALSREAAAHRETQMFLGSLGPILEEAYALLDWARDSAAGLAALPEGPRREALDDPEWQNLNSRLVTLLELAERVQGMPALAALFPFEGRVELPYQYHP
ncbi:MAG: hypothetical protein VKS61_05660 [Candidatus Sericytochromatia bacterium]|nr:hypothetical protein [Candidatus Sericytochromatia bacterium]